MASAPPGRSTFNAVKYWMPDAQCKACTSCGTLFSLFNRKHHCRFCGKIFCHSCSSQTMDGRALGFDGHVRVCDDCKALEGGMTSLSAPSAAPPATGAASSTSAAPSATTTASASAAVSATGQMGSPDVSFEQDSRDLRGAALGAAAMVRDEKDASHGDDASRGAGRVHVDPFAGGGGGIRVFDDRKRLQAPKAQLYNQPINAFSEGILQSLAAVADLHLTLVVRRAVAMYVQPSAAPVGAAPPYVAARPAPLAHHRAQVALPVAARGVPARDGLEVALRDVELDETQAAWATVLLRLARHAVRTCDPNIRGGDKYDVRLYTKVKAITTPSARVGDCELLHGVLYRRNLPHKAMQHDIKEPRILILDDAISFEGGTNTRLLSLETLIDQERKYTEILVHKVLALRPDVLFVSKNVSRLAQELLLRGRASVVTNVKPQVLQRLSRCTGARILPSINYVDKLPENEIIGTLAGRFYVRYFYVPHDAPVDTVPAAVIDADGDVVEPKRKRVAYVVVEGCPEHLGCTILLRGAAADLRAAKRILRHAIFVARNLRLQTLYMFDAYLLNGRWTDADAIDLAAGHLTARVQSALQQLPLIPMLAATRWSVTMPSSPLLDLLSLITNPAGIPRAIGSSSSSSALAAMIEASDARGLSWPSWNEVGDPLTVSERFESVIVAYCTIADGVQCFKPKLRHFSFYAASDCTLGQFLEERCFDEKQPCKQCRKGPAAHTQCFMHHRGRLEVTVHRLATPIPLNYPLQQNGGVATRAAAGDAPAAAAPAAELARPPRAPTLASAPSVDERGALPPAQPALARAGTSVVDGARAAGAGGSRPPPPHVALQPLPALPGSDIVTWSYCSPCKRHVGPATRLSRGAWSLSFGKFMELAFYTPTTTSPDTTCPHTPHVHHVRYFARGKLAAVLRYMPIAPSEVSLAPMPAPNSTWCRIALEKEVGLLLRASALKTTELTGAIKTLQAIIVACERVYTLLVAAHPQRGGRVNSVENDATDGLRHTPVADASLDGSRPPSASDAAEDASSRALTRLGAAPSASSAPKRAGSGAPTNADSNVGASSSPEAAMSSLRQSMADLARLLTIVHAAQQELTQAMQLIMQDVMVSSPMRLSTNSTREDVCVIRTPEPIGRVSSVEAPAANYDVLRVMSHRRTWVRTMLDTEEQLTGLPLVVQRSALVIASVATVRIDEDRPASLPFMHPRRPSVQPQGPIAPPMEGSDAAGAHRPRGSSSSLSAAAATAAIDSSELSRISRAASPAAAAGDSAALVRPTSAEPDGADSAVLLESEDVMEEVGIAVVTSGPLPQQIADAVRGVASPPRPRNTPLTSAAHLRLLLSKMTPDLLAGRFRQFSAGLGARETADVDSVFGGHLLLPPGMQDTVIPVTPSLTASMLAYSLSSELYWDKLHDVVKAAESRLFGAAAGEGPFSSEVAQDVPHLLLPTPHELIAPAGADGNAPAVLPFHADDDDGDGDVDVDGDGPDTNHIMDEYERTTAADDAGDSDEDAGSMLDSTNPSLPPPPASSFAPAGALRSAPSALGGVHDVSTSAVPIPRKATVRNLSAPSGDDGESRQALGHVLHMSGSYAQAHITLTPAMSAASRRVSRRSTGVAPVATPLLSAGSPPTSVSRRSSTLISSTTVGFSGRSDAPPAATVDAFPDAAATATPTPAPLLPHASTLLRATRTSAVPSEASVARLRLARRTHAAVSVSDTRPAPVHELPDVEIALLRRHSICSPTRQEIYRENRYAALGPGVVIGVEPRDAAAAADADESSAVPSAGVTAAPSSFLTPQLRRSVVRGRESYVESGTAMTSSGARISLVNASPSVRHSGFSTLQRLLSDEEFSGTDAVHSGRASLLALTPARQSVLSTSRPSFHAAIGVIDGEGGDVEQELPARAVRASMSGWSWTSGDLHTLTMTLPPPPQLLPRPPSARRGRSSLTREMAATGRPLPVPPARLRSLPEAASPGGSQAASPSGGMIRSLTGGDDGTSVAPASSRPPRAARSSMLPTDLSNVSRMDAAEAVLLEAQQQAHTAVTLTAGRTTPRATAMRRTSPSSISNDGETAPTVRSRVSTHQSILELPGAEDMERDSPDSGDEHERVQTMAAITVTATERSAASATALLSFPTPMSARVSRSNSRSAFAFEGDAGNAAGAAGIAVNGGVLLRPVTPAAGVPRAAVALDGRKGRTASGATPAPHNVIDATASSAAAVRATEAFGKPLPLRADEMLLSDVQSDILHTFSDQNPASLASFSVTSVWAMHFHALRDLCFDSQRTFVQSLAWSEIWRASGGKSGASFERTQDDRLVVKHIRKSEFDMFKRYIAPAYFAHMHAALVEGQPSMLVKILGVYKVVSQVAGGARDVRHVIVMENLFRGRAIQPGLKFDLKGKAREQKKMKPLVAVAQPSPLSRPPAGAAEETSVFGATLTPRAADGSTPVMGGGSTPSAAGADNLVLLDGDLMVYTRGLPLPLTEDAKQVLDINIQRDTDFLNGLKVIDYSVLVGIDVDSGVIVMGIIDYFRVFDIMSRFEEQVKRGMAVVTNVEPTVVQPERYMARLRKALDRYFVLVPTKLTLLADAPNDAGTPGVVTAAGAGGSGSSAPSAAAGASAATPSAAGTVLEDD